MTAKGPISESGRSVSGRRAITVTGIGVSPGVAIGHVHLLDRRQQTYARHHISAGAVPDELERLNHATGLAIEALQALKGRVEEGGQGEHTAILDAHLLMLQDPMLIDATVAHIERDLQCAEWALRTTVCEIKERFDKLADNYFRERRSDVDFVGDRILAALSSERDGLDQVPDDAVIVAHDISPADTLALLKYKVRAFVTEVGGETSHTALLARALEIPAIVAATSVLEKAGAGDGVVVDGSVGRAILHPSRKVLSRYGTIAAKRADFQHILEKEALLEATTPDGHRLKVLANIELETEVDGVTAHGAAGIGLYRTEFLYLGRKRPPPEVEHLRAYKRVLAATTDDQPVYIRTFDLGSDKVAACVPTYKEENPALGLRGTRLGLHNEVMLRRQVRAILRATAHGRGALMFPMISGPAEFRRVRTLVDEEMERLENAGHPVWREIPVGIMIEVPSAVWTADHLAEEADFFSIGTNDLIQYLLAIDRGNEHVAYLYHPLHLSLLRAIKHVIDVGHHAGIEVSLCGQMAADPVCVAVCMGLGFDAISMPTAAIPAIKYAIRRFPITDAQQLVAECFELSTFSEIESHVCAAMHARVPELMRHLTSNE